MKRIAALGFSVLALGLSACGIRGDLERPPPLWGEAERPAETDAETGGESDPGAETPNTEG